MRKLLLPLLLLACGSANALITMSLWETSYNGQSGVMFQFSGSANTDALSLSPHPAFINIPFIDPSGAYLSNSPTFTPVDVYSGISGPTNIGSLYNTSGTYVSGPAFSIDGARAQIHLPYEYTSASFITGEAFFDGVTLAWMGLTIGDTFEWTWGTGANADKIVLEILSGPPVPEPSAYAAAIAAVGLVATCVVRRRRNKV